MPAAGGRWSQLGVRRRAAAPGRQHHDDGVGVGKAKDEGWMRQRRECVLGQTYRPGLERVVRAHKVCSTREPTGPSLEGLGVRESSPGVAPRALCVRGRTSGLGVRLGVECSQSGEAVSCTCLARGAGSVHASCNCGAHSTVNPTKPSTRAPVWHEAGVGRVHCVQRPCASACQMAGAQGACNHEGLCASGFHRRGSERLLGGAGRDSDTSSGDSGSEVSGRNNTCQSQGSDTSAESGTGSVEEGSSVGSSGGAADARRVVPRRRARRRGRAESYCELEARFERYAHQINRLIGRRGQKWKKIEAVRSRQRRVLVRMLEFPVGVLSKALRRVRPYVLGAEALAAFERDVDTEQVYVHVHPQVRHSY